MPSSEARSTAEWLQLVLLRGKSCAEWATRLQFAPTLSAPQCRPHTMENRNLRIVSQDWIGHNLCERLHRAEVNGVDWSHRCCLWSPRCGGASANLGEDLAGDLHRIMGHAIPETPTIKRTPQSQREGSQTQCVPKRIEEQDTDRSLPSR
jgi:hypothetical protein